MPSPVELTQLKIQYQRNVGTPRASNRIELGATEPAPGSTSSASTFLSLTRVRLGELRAARVLSQGRGRSPTGPLPTTWDQSLATRPVNGSRATPLPRATRA